MAIATIRKLAFRFGYDVTLRRLPQFETKRRELKVPRDMEPDFVELYEQAREYSMTSPERMYSLWQAVRHVVRYDIPGDLVECGVWRGGSAMMMALTLLQQGVRDRGIWLYDTFAGMTRPGEVDRRAKDNAEMISRWEHFQRDTHNEWTYASLDEVKENMARTGYPMERLNFVKGEVESTLPGTRPEAISALRLDTDWYQSTYHELTHLYPLLSRGGVLLLDDYGSFQGAKKAVDQYIQEQNLDLLLQRVDSTGRNAVKS
jgi:hypothetical protein